MARAIRFQQMATDVEDVLAKEQADIGADVQVFKLSNPLDASREDVRVSMSSSCIHRVPLCVRDSLSCIHRLSLHPWSR